MKLIIPKWLFCQTRFTKKWYRFGDTDCLSKKNTLQGINIPSWEKENHLQNAIFGGYVSFLEGIILLDSWFLEASIAESSSPSHRRQIILPSRAPRKELDSAWVIQENMNNAAFRQLKKRFFILETTQRCVNTYKSSLYQTLYQATVSGNIPKIHLFSLNKIPKPSSQPIISCSQHCYLLKSAPVKHQLVTPSFSPFTLFL